jgi:intracellular sulfur oxidation DsrE/DsrF family protein
MKKHLLWMTGLLACTLSWAEIKVVYHLSAKIVVVTHGLGIDFLIDGATNPSGQSFAGGVSDLVNKGVEFRVCNNTLVSRKISADKLLMEAKVVPSGVAEVAKLQANEKFVYLRP